MSTEVEHDTEQHSESEMLAAFEATQDGQPLPTETPAETQTEAPAEKPQEPKVEYAQITKQEYESLMARAAEIDQIKATQEKSLGTAFGKIGGIERRLAEMQSAPTAPVFDISDEEIDGLREDFPQLAGALSKLKSAKPAAIDPETVRSLVKQRMEESAADIQRVVNQQVELKLIGRRHKDWQEVTSGEEFAAWAKAKGGEYISQLATASAAYDSDFIGDAIDQFKASKAKAASSAETRRSRFDSAVNPRGAAPVQTDNASAEEALMAGFKSSS